MHWPCLIYFTVASLAVSIISNLLGYLRGYKDGLDNT